MRAAEIFVHTCMPAREVELSDGRLESPPSATARGVRGRQVPLSQRVAQTKQALYGRGDPELELRIMRAKEALYGRDPLRLTEQSLGDKQNL